MEDLPDHVWRDWMNLPSDTEEEDAGQRDLQSWTPTSSMHTLYDSPSVIEELHMHQSPHPFYDALLADSKTETGNHNIWSAATLASDEPQSGHTAAPVVLSIRDAAPLKPCSPEPPSSILHRFPTLYSGQAKPWTGETALHNRQPDQSTLHDNQTLCLSQQISFQHLPITSRNSHLSHAQSGSEGHRPLPADLNYPFMRQECLQQLESNQGPGRYPEHDVDRMDTIMHENHIVTNELPWEKGRLVPAQASQPAFHTFTINGEPVEQTTRKPCSELRLKQIKEMRKLRSCLRCQRDKKRVSLCLQMLLPRSVLT